MSNDASLPTATAQQSHPPVRTTSADVVGGVTADTEVMTTDGPLSVPALEPGNRVYALDPLTGLLKPKLLVEVHSVSNESSLIEIAGQRVNLRLHPTHPIPYRTKGIPTPRFVRAEHLPEREYYRFINSWKTTPGTRLDDVDITDLLDEFQARATTTCHGHTFRAALPDGCDPTYVNSHSGYHFDAQTFKRYQSRIESIAETVTIRERRNQRTHPYRFDGDDFVELIGWFVTEGSVYWSDAKYTAEVKFAQETPRHRRRIRTLLNRLGFSSSEKSRCFTFSSTLLGSLLESMCGTASRTKHLPSFVWRLATDQKRLLLRTLLRGDGNERGTYYTSSERLASDVLRLALEVGYKPRYTHRESGVWQVSLSQGNDGFRASMNVSTVAGRGPLYRLVIEDFSTIIAGRKQRFQWVGASGVE